MNQEIPYYNKALDGVRGLAILLVLMAHMQLLHYGWIGVQLFFVLSGFLITNILLREKEKPVSLKKKFKNFWVRRVLRIFPLYYLYLFLLMIVWLVSETWQVHSVNLPSLFTYTFNFLGPSSHPHPYSLTGQLWSLSVEEQFYIFYPFIVLLCNKKQLRIAAVVLIIFSVAFRFLTGNYLLQSGMAGGSVGSTIYSATFSHFDAFLLGGSITIFNTYKISLRVRNFLFLVLLAVTLVAGYFVYLQIKPGPFDFNDYFTHLGYSPDFVQYQHHVWSYFLIDLLFVFLLLLLISSGKNLFSAIINKSFSFAPLVAIGKISYGMYIIHIGIRHVIIPIAHNYNIYNKYILFVLYLPVVYGLAWIIYQVYEKRFLQMKEKFR
jgi:peptidoglycan/LPS O-acetylase OafA/YrhL